MRVADRFRIAIRAWVFLPLTPLEISFGYLDAGAIVVAAFMEISESGKSDGSVLLSRIHRRIAEACLESNRGK